MHTCPFWSHAPNQVSKVLIDKYEGAVVVQALTLVWSR